MLALKIAVIAMIATTVSAFGLKEIVVEKEATVNEKPVTQPALRADCNSSLIWFEVQSGAQTDCGDLSQINPSLLIPHNLSNPSNPLGDMSTFQFDRTGAMNWKEGCTESNNNNCAVGYEADAGNFSSETGAWLPNAGATPVCYICRP